MYIFQVRDYFVDKRETPAPLTERLVKSGYQQPRGGYIDLAKKQGFVVNYKIAEPSQYWHLIEAYCPSVSPYKKFSRSIVCGELIFWMAEVSNAVPYDTLYMLLERIIEDGDNNTAPPKFNRIK